MTKVKGASPPGNRDMPSEAIGPIKSVTFEEMQAACWVVLNSSFNGEDASELLGMLGLQPDQEYLRATYLPAS